jgi:hypothetical protein
LSIVPSKLITPGDIGKTPNKVLPTDAVSPTSSSSFMTKKEKKKALLKAMLDSFNETDDDDTASEASSASVFDPQRNYFGNSSFESPDNIPRLEDL